MKKRFAFAWDNGGGPWGKPKNAAPGKNTERRTPSGTQQPELEDVMNQMADKLRGMWQQGGGGGMRGRDPNELLPAWLSWEWVVLGVVLLWTMSGFYTISTEQQGVVTRFGAYVKTTYEGLNYHAPWPLESVTKVPVSQVRQVTIGGAASDFEGSDLRDSGLMLTGDGNMLDLTFTVQWRVTDPAAFLFNVAGVERTVAMVAESAVREVIGQYDLNSALTNGREQIAPLVKKHLQQILDYYGAGVEIMAINLQQVNPPNEVIDAFRDVQAAEADQQRKVNEANTYKNKILPLAEGQVAQIKQEALAYKLATEAAAAGAAARFNAQVEAYQAAPKVTRDRLYLETMQDVLKDVPKVVVTGRGTQNVLPYLPLDRLPGAKPAPATTEGGR